MTTLPRWKAAFAGTFYPDVPSVLEDELGEWMDEEPKVAGPVIGALVPHAGYVYSGRTAARAVARIRSDEVDTVVVFALSHRRPLSGIARIDVAGFDTPLGGIEVDQVWPERAALAAAGVRAVDAFAEHSLEVQLPLIQHAWPRARIVPLVFGHCSHAQIEAVASAVADAMDARTRLIATTDLSHYHDRVQARRLDDVFVTEIVEGDADSLARALDEHRTEACGVGPTLAFRRVVDRLEGRVLVVERRDSGDAFGETDRVVGYVSALALGASSPEGGRP